MGALGPVLSGSVDGGEGLVMVVEAFWINSVH